MIESDRDSEQSGGFTAYSDGFEAEFMDKPHSPWANLSS